jgi:hypothetical protein
MLTKQERNAIAERLSRCEGLGDLYYAVIGEELPTTTSYEQDVDAIFTRLFDLCDTSNMIELPLDRDGEIIRIGDIVYDENHIKYRVDGYVMHSACKSIVRLLNSRPVLTNRLASSLHHKETATAKSLAKQIKDILNDEGEVTLSDLLKLGDIAEQLETLGDGNE